MATRCNILAWRIPCTDKPGGLSSVGSQRVRLRLSNLALSFTDLGKTVVSLTQKLKFSLVCLYIKGVVPL